MADQLHDRSAERDIEDLRTLLDDVLSIQVSSEARDTVEVIRAAAIEYRQGTADSREGLHQVLEELDHEELSMVARAFTTYFVLINLAEERERVRAIRTAAHEGRLEDGIETAVEELSEDPERAHATLADVLIEPTFTAHPTEARRKTVKAKLWSIAGRLETLDERLLTRKERAQVMRDLDAEVTSLWQTPHIRKRRPEPEDEARNVQWYLENTLFDVVGEVYDELETALEDALDEDAIEVPKLFEFRSWAGSDRDGNPFVTPRTTAETLERQRSVVLDRYRERLKALSGILSQDGDRVTVSADLERSLVADRKRLPEVTDQAERRYHNEPYRQKLFQMRERLERVGDVRPGGYTDPGELAADLRTIERSLRENDADTVVEAHVRPLRRQVATFGFSLASLDLRDHRQRHTEAVAEALDREGIDYRDLDEAERQSVLTEAIEQEKSMIDVDGEGLSDTAREVLELFDAWRDWQAEYGRQAIDTYCISMTEEPSHVLEVLFLADQTGVVDLPDYAGLDVVPLLETEYALSNAERIMGTLFENPAYAGLVDARDDLQEVMLGYSDSSKENGFLAANWDLYRNQRRLGSVCDEHDITLRLFHGRGGSISRGGGPMGEALLALPSDTVTGPVKFTEQGEAIAEKYANDRIAERNIEQMLSAQLRARFRARADPDPDVPEEWIAAMETMAEAARGAYRNLLETDGFVEYFETATPITVIEDLRAIPWVFSWTQARCIITGWYALASGIDAYLDAGGSTETLQAMYEAWPFFRTTLDNAALALARTDLEIAAEYADLAPPRLRERFFPRIREEYDRATELVTTIAGRDALVQREWLRESLDRRNPYVDPLNLLQSRLLAQNHRTALEERTLRLTVKGIAAGMKNTG